ncbi:hypothetical protein JCM8097_007302 [Rhodosporidiobolus ruineniae]
MPPPPASSVVSRLHQALRTINSTAPRIIASPVQAGGGPIKRASVAIIIRLRPEHPPPGSTVSSATSPTTSPSHPTLPLHPSPPSSPSPPSYAPSSATSASASSTGTSVLSQLDEFFAQPWVQDPKTGVEILYIKRATRGTDRWSGHMAFPGGRTEPDDESAEFTALRETWEEVAIDLADKDWISIGQLDDREITTSLGKRLLMILSPFIFLHTSPYAPMPELQESEVASAYWIPLELLHPPGAKYGSVEIDIATRLAPRNKTARGLLQLLMGKMDFRCILLPNDPVATGAPVPSGTTLPDIRLWGLTLGMTLDVLSHMNLAAASPDLSTYPYGVSSRPPSFTSSHIAGSKSAPLIPTSFAEASIFPRFSHPDINLLIYLFSFRYRRLLRHPGKLREASSAAAGGGAGGGKKSPSYGRVNWAGMEATLFYASVRKALVVAVLLRATALLGGLGTLVWWFRSRWAGGVKKR